MEILELSNKKYRVSGGALNYNICFYYSKWFYDFVKSFEDKEIKFLSEKQKDIFRKNMISDDSDYNGARKIFISKDLKYLATFTEYRHGKFALSVRNLIKEKRDNIKRDIKILISEIREDLKNGMFDYVEEDKRELRNLIIEYRK